MRKVAHGKAWFASSAKQRVLELMRAQCSAMRSAYQAMHKHGLRDNDVRVYVKRNYMTLLNQRYVADACNVAKRISQDGAVFGGKWNWRQMVNRAVSKKE